jgi:nitric-oxide synthase
MNACPIPARPIDTGNVFRRWDLGVEVPAKDMSAPDDLTAAARAAWRNAPRCVGRLHWKSLQVLDARSVDGCDEVFEAVCAHLDRATAGGRIQPLMTVFPQWKGETDEVRIWNHQLLRYAGHELPQGGVLGDPMNVELTRLARQLGWSPPANPGRFDLLPLNVQAQGRLRWYELPRRLVLEVPLRHPRHDWFEKLGLKWYAVPALADMILATGRAAHPCAPFNGWYMGTEIGARNLGDETRYNLLPVVAEHLGLETRCTRNLWRDHALLVLNEAVLESFERDGVRLIDHHQATSEFEAFCGAEQRAGRDVSADWSWIVPPISGSSTPVFHRSYVLQPELPALLLQAPPWQTERGRRLLAQAVR